MAKSLLFLRFEGPIQSWGTKSRWDVRDTSSEPTKSGVLGLIGCAMGVRRTDKELELLEKDLRFGVRVDYEGVIATDFHTVSGYHLTAAGEYKHMDGSAKSLEKAMEHKENVIVSLRDYIHDAAFLVALEVWREENSALLERIAHYLQNPVWPVYLGRKCCVPVRPLFERLSKDYDCIEEALSHEPLCARRSARGKRIGKIKAWIECADGKYERQDALRLNELRYYDFRRCKRIEIDPDLIRRGT